MTKDKSLIPPGQYCYVTDMLFEGEKEEFKIPIVRCPFSTTREIDGVYIPWCSYLELGGDDNNWTDEDYQKVLAHYGTREEMDKELPLSLLWDDCKECGLNDEVDDKVEDYMSWVNKIKRMEKETGT